MSFAKRSYKKELLDGDDIPYEDVVANMHELNVVNKFLGGHKITAKGVSYFLNGLKLNKPLAIAEIGCGGGDNLVAIRNFLASRKMPVSLTGVDIKQECISYARMNSPATIQYICSDYRTVNWKDGKPDIIFSSLFCHHFTDNELVPQLQWMRENSNIGFFINDIHRHPLAFYSIALLTRLFSRSYLVKNDAPLSVKRAFQKADWARILPAAGVSSYHISWQWAFRYLICVRNGA